MAEKIRLHMLMLARKYVSQNRRKQEQTKQKYMTYGSHGMECEDYSLLGCDTM
jgi:hypothetical protein